MLKKICKQREKIEKLAARENDAAEKLELLRQELAGERDALDEMEKEHLFSLMRERELSLEETIALFEKGAEVLTEEETEPEEMEDAEQEAAPDEENIFTEDLAADFIEKQDEETDTVNLFEEAAGEYGGFWRR